MRRSVGETETFALTGRPARLWARYPIVCLDALVVKIRDAGHVRNKAIYVAIGVDMKGTKEVLGLWASLLGTNGEAAKFWLQVLTELKNRGVHEVFIVCVDGLKGFPGGCRNCVPRSAGASLKSGLRTRSA